MNTERLMRTHQIFDLGRRLIHWLTQAGGGALIEANQTERFAMLRGSLVELPTARPLEVASAGGALWLTLDNDSRDLVLDCGQRMLLETPKRALVYALNDALMEVRRMNNQQVRV